MKKIAKQLNIITIVSLGLICILAAHNYRAVWLLALLIFLAPYGLAIRAFDITRKAGEHAATFWLNAVWATIGAVEVVDNLLVGNGEHAIIAAGWGLLVSMPAVLNSVVLRSQARLSGENNVPN